MKKYIEKIIEFFKENTDIFNEAIEELDSYNDYLGENRYYSMEEIDELYSDAEPTDILRRAFYGYDETYTASNNSDEHFAPFNPNKNYFRFNGYGNFVSSDYKDYSDFITEETVEEMSENRYYIDAIDEDEELSTLFDKLENEEEEEE